MKSKLPTGWEKVKLGEVIELTMGQSPKSKYYNDTGKGLPFMQGNTTFGRKYPTVERYTTKAPRIAKKNDVLMSVRAPVGDLNISNIEELCIGRGLCSIRMKNNMQEFIYFAMKYNMQVLKSRESGTVFSSINKRDLESLPIILPPLAEQKTIADTLSAVDDKIENNNKINKNLEQQAQEIFKHWFVDFEFPDKNGMPYKSSGGEMEESELGIIPKGWEVKELLEVMDFQGGSQPPKKEHLYEEKEGYIRFIQNRDYAGNPKHLTYIPVSTRNKLANKYDILIDKYGEAGKTRYGIAGAYNVALAKVEPKNIENREYIRRFLEQKNIVTYLYNASIASTRPSLNRSTFTGLKFAMPTYDVEKEFNDFSLNIIDIILKNKEENRKLARLRDTLLPKLMSGELRIPLDE